MGKNIRQVERVFEVAGILAAVVDGNVYCMLPIPVGRVKEWQYGLLEYKRELYACVGTASAKLTPKKSIPKFQQATEFFKSEFSGGKSAEKRKPVGKTQPVGR